MQKVILEPGTRFGQLTVIGEGGKNKWGCFLWLCRCDCGNEKLCLYGEMKRGKTVSCGCVTKSNKITAISSHKQTYTPEYKIWKSMRHRCSPIGGHPRYAGRGIGVCERWRSFENFISDMGKRPSNDLSIERIDNDKDYEPSNCKWGTMHEQSRNKRGNNWVEHNGIKMIKKDWADYFGVKTPAIDSHLRHGKSFPEVYDFYMKKMQQ